MVFLRSDFEDPGEANEEATGHMVLFDTLGRIVPPFDGNNYLSEGDIVFAYRRDGASAVAVTGRYGSGGWTARWHVRILHVVPATATQRSALSVVLGPPTYGRSESSWTWELGDLDADGVPEVTIGPRAKGGAIEARATYSYSEEMQGYVGPTGAKDGEFHRFDAPDMPDGWTAAEEFARTNLDQGAIERALRAEGEDTHERTGLRFPRATRMLYRSRLRPIPSGPPGSLGEHDIALTYQASGDEHMTVSVYLYAKVPPLSTPDEPLAKHAERVRDEVRISWKDASCWKWSAPPALSQERTSTEVCRMRDKKHPDRGLLQSYIVIRDLDGYWLKFRATTPAKTAPVLERALIELINSIKRGEPRPAPEYV